MFKRGSQTCSCPLLNVRDRNIAGLVTPFSVCSNTAPIAYCEVSVVTMIGRSGSYFLRTGAVVTALFNYSNECCSSEFHSDGLVATCNVKDFAIEGQFLMSFRL